MNKVYRLYKKMHDSHNKIYKKIVHVWLRTIYTCDIMPQTQIGENAHFAHQGLGVVINQDAIIGNNVKIGAHVIIGGRKGNPVVPRIGDNVEIGAGAIILGEIIIGNNAIIGAGSVVINSVPENAVVVGNPGKVIKYLEEEKS